MRININSDPEESVSWTKAGSEIYETAKEITRPALFQGFSYTFLFGVLSTQIILNRLESDNNETGNLGASTLTATLLNILGTFVMALLFGVSIYTAGKRGELEQLQQQPFNSKRAKKIERLKVKIATTPFIGAGMGSLTWPLTIPISACSEPLLIAMGQDPENAALTAAYLKSAIAVYFPLSLRINFEQVMFGFNHQFWPMVISWVTYTLGLLSSIAFGFGHYSFPKLGFAGVAIGPAIDSILTAIAYFFYLVYHKDFKDFGFFRRFPSCRQGCKQFIELLRIGGPILFTVINEIGSQLTIPLLAGLLGSKELAAQNYGSLFIFFGLIFLYCFGQKTSQMVSSAIGEKSYRKAYNYAWGGLLASIIVLLIPYIIVCAQPKILTHGIVDSQAVSGDVIRLGSQIIPIQGAYLIFNNICYNMAQVLRSTGDHFFVTTATTTTLWFGVLFGYLGGFTAGLGLPGLNGGNALGLLVTGVIPIFLRWYKQLQPNALASKFATLTPNTSKKNESLFSSLSNCCLTLLKRQKETKNPDINDPLLKATTSRSESTPNSGLELGS